MKLLFRFMLIGLHFMFSFFLFIVSLVRELKIFLSNFVCFRLPAQSQTFDVDQLINTSQHLKKLPEHFVLLIGENDISLKDVTNIIKWCITAGIRFVSVYDHEGNIKTFKRELLDSLESQQNDEKNEKPVNYLIRSGLNEANKSINGCCHGVKDVTCYVTLLSSHDGRNEIVNKAIELAEQVAAKTLDPAKFEFRHLEEKLINPDTFPYPNLLVSCGKIRSTIGFLPWHLHLTEILNYETHFNFTIEKFIKVLKQYSKCEQRLGK